MRNLKNNFSPNDVDSLALYVSNIVEKESGNILGDNQQNMVVSRLKKRIHDLGDLSPEQYYSYLQTNYKEEVLNLTSILTTHHTFFFREFLHFEYVLNNLDKIVAKVKARGDNKIRIISNACSSGQEVYSLAMFFYYHLKDYQGISFEIIGTDIDPQSINFAKNGVYPYNQITSIPHIYLKGNWQKGTGDISHFAKIKSHIKNHCQFQVMNLLDCDKDLSNKFFDLIFCRNVFIYFEQNLIKKIVLNLKKYLHTNGIFFTGISESLNTIDIPKKTLAPSAYSFTIEDTQESESKVLPVEKTPVIHTFNKIPNPIRILSVDDSGSILKILTKIFNEDKDFELVGTASNGKEAETFLQNNKVDAMTLDIHMPEMDGVEYLKKNFSSDHPHVVVVSSSRREDARYAQQTLKHGASDFVEKPALNNIQERAEEIKNKIKMSFLNHDLKISEIDKSFGKEFSFNNINQKSRIFIGSFSDKNKILSTIKELQGDQPPIFIFFEGNENFLPIIEEEFKSLNNVKIFEPDNYLDKNIVYLCDLKKDSEIINNLITNYKKSISIFGIVSKQVENLLFKFENSQILIEDTKEINNHVKEIATDIFPWTSFACLGTEYLAED